VARRCPSRERDQDVNWSKYNWGAITPMWGIPANTPVFLNISAGPTPTISINMGGQLVGGGVFAGGYFLHPGHGPRGKDYQTTIDEFAGPSAFSWVPLGGRRNCGPLAMGTYCPVEQQQVTEDVDAAYIMLKFGGDETNWGSVNVRGNIGARFVKTEVSAVGGVQFPQFTMPTNCTASPGNPVSALCLTPTSDQAFMNQAAYSQTGGGDSTDVLPSLNLRFGLSDKTFFRFAASRALARPDMGLYKNYIGISLVQPGCDNGTTVTIRRELHSKRGLVHPALHRRSGNRQLDRPRPISST
jgi:hypothetical protein